MVTAVRPVGGGSSTSVAPLRTLESLSTYVDAVGQPGFPGMLLIALIVGVIPGATGAAANGVKTWDEFLLWVVGGVLTIGCWMSILLGVCALLELDASVTRIATVGLFLFGTTALFGAVVSPLLDNIDSPMAWLPSFLIKWVQSPLLTTASLVATMIVMIGGGKVDFRRGMLFVAVGPGRAALALGAVGWTQAGCFLSDGTVPDNLARHESIHSRTVAAIGEFGFYLTYITIGAIWGLAQGGSWNNLNVAGCGNPFEKTAHRFTDGSVMPRSD